METRKEYPRTWIAAVNFAHMRYNVHDYENAFGILEAARKDYPQVWEIISFESELIRETRGPEAALCLVEDFAHDNWWHYGAALALGRLYAQKNDANRAEERLAMPAGSMCMTPKLCGDRADAIASKTDWKTRCERNGDLSLASRTNRVNTFNLRKSSKEWGATMKRAPFSRKRRVCALWPKRSPPTEAEIPSDRLRVGLCTYGSLRHAWPCAFTRIKMSIFAWLKAKDLRRHRFWRARPRTRALNLRDSGVPRNRRPLSGQQIARNRTPQWTESFRYDRSRASRRHHFSRVARYGNAGDL